MRRIRPVIMNLTEMDFRNQQGIELVEGEGAKPVAEELCLRQERKAAQHHNERRRRVCQPFEKLLHMFFPVATSVS